MTPKIAYIAMMWRFAARSFSKIRFASKLARVFMKKAPVSTKALCLSGWQISFADPEGESLKQKALPLRGPVFFQNPLREQARTRLYEKSPGKYQGFLFVGMARFELATSWSQTRRDNRATLHPEQ